MKTTLEELLAFRAVVDTGSITAAADQLAQTVSGISRALSRLEKKLGTTLLRRTTRRLELTEEGRAFLARTRLILDAMDQAEEEMTMRRETPSGLLRVNAASSFMLHAVVPLMPAFHALYPKISLALDTDDLNVDLLEQRTDIAIRIGTLRDSTLHARPLCASPLRLLASPAYLEQHGKPRRATDLDHHTLIGNSKLPALNQWPLRTAQGDRYSATLTFSASSGETMRHLALAGMGIACIADFMTGADRKSGALVQVLTKETLDVRQSVNAVYYRNTALSSRITAFLDFLAARLQ
ncbi:LysR family transcriptional regulator [Rhodoferax saidenbachensis]|uniref:LysR family transcriptional regulator n=1 Tax=Rhodoferax saidenbachensis TaxID=1484693 RepID=A0A1P8KEU8_9BURK|nr:LysR family transcriptional regulator [Rhodoferax saidenbachensis]APW44553.1 LysR family transcriptional regulator [Rhodoferax saidenbachensis]